MRKAEKIRKEPKNEYLGFSRKKLQSCGALNTAREICSQPKLWLETWRLINKQKKELSAYLKRVSEDAHSSVHIILTGAGTSAFIGSCLEGIYNQKFAGSARAVPTTDLVTHPDNYLINRPTLLISFARSGNSPESLAAVNLADHRIDQVYHLAITCNAEGRLAKTLSGKKSESVYKKDNSYVFLMPPEAEDRGLAMTGSFSSMLLAGYLMLQPGSNALNEIHIKTLINYGTAILNDYAQMLYDISIIDYQRVIILGSGPLNGIAREAQLKIQELTDGKIMGMHDSFLGFRHGPKAVTNEHTLLIYLFSNLPDVFRYEEDLVHSVNETDDPRCSLGVFEDHYKTDGKMDYVINLSNGNEAALPEPLLGAAYILIAQIIGFYTSIFHNLTPDNPSVSGSISRVVKGVRIYS